MTSPCDAAQTIGIATTNARPMPSTGLAGWLHGDRAQFHGLVLDDKTISMLFYFFCPALALHTPLPTHPLGYSPISRPRKSTCEIGKAAR